MKLKQILQKQGELYKNLPKNKTIQKHNETIKTPKLVPYKNYKISEQEYEAITELEKFLNTEPTITNGLLLFGFEISIQNNQITHLRIANWDYVKEIPKSINKLTNLKKLDLFNNRISEIKNLDNLTNLQVLILWFNPIKNEEEIKKLKEKGIKVITKEKEYREYRIMGY